MKVAVFDTYVLKSNGDTAHFDIIAPEGKYSLEEILAFGKQYLQGLGEGDAPISAAECQFCHIEAPTPDMLESIARKGFFILEMSDIPAALPENPSRRHLIEFIRAKSESHRFGNFRQHSEEGLRHIIEALA